MSISTRSSIVASLLTILATPTVWAQSTPAPPAAADSGTLEEIVITAQRRSENLQTVPIAVTALSGDQLENKAVVRLSDLQFVAPSLSVTDAGLTQSINIRGIGLASGSPAVANGVAEYVDGLFQPPIVTTNSFYDVANIEVLRGPQGTLVGSNSTGGAIFINTQSPKLNVVEGYGELSYGNYESRTAQGAINLPLGDTLAFRAAGNYTDHDTFYNSVGPAHTNAGMLDEKSGRLSVLWKPGDFQALAKVEYTDRNTGGYAYRPIPGTQYAPFAPSGDFNLSYDSPEENHERGLISGLELRYELPNGIVLRSLTGYQDKNIHNLYDTDGTSESSSANPQQTEDQYVRERETTEEVNVISPTGGRYNWILGAYGQHNLINVNILNESAGFPVYITNPQNKTSTGWFAQLNFKLNDQFELQTGLRYSTFKVDGVGSVVIGTGIPGFPPGGIQVADLSGVHKDDRPTGKVTLNYTLDDHNLFYLFAARGYKPGGFNSSTSQFNPETVWDYEGGWKSTLLDGHLRTQLGAFYNRYYNFQFGLTDLTTGTNGVENLPTATIKGLEGQVQAQLGAWAFDGGIAYVDSNLQGTGSFVNTRLLPPGTLGPQCPAGTASNPPTCFDYGPYLQTSSSGPNLYSPKFSFNAGVEYRIPLPNNISLTPRLNYAFVGSQYTALSYSPLTDYLPSRGLLSALLTLRLPHAWNVEAYGTNLANKVYVSGQGGNQEFFGPPRQYGARVNKTF
jgi:iron complex outermembrane receptor protein